MYEKRNHFQNLGDDSFFDHFFIFSVCAVIRHKFLTNSNDNININAPEKAKDALPKINAGSTVISMTLKIIETNTNNDVRLKIMEITSPI